MNNSYIASSIPLDPPYITFPELLKRRADENPNKAAYVFIDEGNKRSEITFQELYTKAECFAKALVKNGVKKGDIIGLSGRNVPEWLIANFGIQMAGGCTLPLPFCYKKENLVHLLNSLAPVKFLIFDPGLDNDNLEILKSITNQISPDGTTSSSLVPTLTKVILFRNSTSLPITCSVDEMCTQQNEIALPCIDPEDMALLILSSGSTGLSKAAPQSHHALVIMSMLFVSISTSNNQSDIFYSDRAFFWSGGYPQFEMGCGATRVTLSNALRLPSAMTAAEVACEIIMKEKATLTYFVPSMLELIMKKNINLKIDKIMTGSSPLFSSLTNCIGKICNELQLVYGMTEVAAIASRTLTADNKEGYSGLLSLKPLPGVELKVADEDRFLQPVGTRGHIYIRSSKRFVGYLNHRIEAGLEEYLLKSGWMLSEDGGYIKEDNTIVVEGRSKDVIDVNGRKIFPYEIEHAIKSNPSVLDAIVIPVKEKESGDRVPCAAIIYKIGREESKENMQSFIRKQFNITKENRLMAALYVPQILETFKEFPLMCNGKADRRAIKDLVQANVDKTKYE